MNRVLRGRAHADYVERLRATVVELASSLHGAAEHDQGTVTFPLGTLRLCEDPDCVRARSLVPNPRGDRL